MAIDLVMLTAPDGKYLAVHSSEVVALRGKGSAQMMHEGVRCLVFTADGKFLSVVETCAEVRQKLEVSNPETGGPVPLPKPRP